MAEDPVTPEVFSGRLLLPAPTGFARASLLGALDIPVDHVVSATVVDDAAAEVRGWRTGIGLPHLWMGTWRHDGVRDYVAVRPGAPGAVITLRDEAFARIIVTLEDAAGLCARLVPASPG